jgi:hypothetical protein
MMKDARSGVIDAIVVYSIDRLTRRITELTSFLEEQKEYGFAFATTEGEDTSSASGRMVLTIKGAVAQQETERMAERVTLPQPRTAVEAPRSRSPGRPLRPHLTPPSGPTRAQTIFPIPSGRG